MASICRQLSERGLMRQKLPERVEIVGRLPRTPSGKVQKFELRARIAALVQSESGYQ
jgi:acyl-CoA synthetase (AMP-forming)/AMP-acid ligase II